MFGGTASWAPTVGRGLGTPHRSPKGYCGEFWGRPLGATDLVLDFFAGSGTTGAVALRLDRRFVLIDDNPQALSVMKERLGDAEVRYLEVGG